MTSLTRRAPDALLVVMTVTGLVGGVALVLLAPGAWHALPPFLLLAAGGAWGIAAKERGDTKRRARALTTLRAAAVLLGIVAVALLVLAFFGVALGTWIS
ncbi:MAG TPA: hypothetical protein PKC83_12325 [Gemmatimonadaceae bacterium]|nr:MAG: hypothetical protein ABS52_13920 [Gemmatimonadetes bacterium SCN 70-22]HMN09558.1 hypothetical protein [Gemmatimonadaceae bacterium]